MVILGYVRVFSDLLEGVVRVGCVLKIYVLLGKIIGLELKF